MMTQTRMRPSSTRRPALQLVLWTGASETDGRRVAMPLVYERLSARPSLALVLAGVGIRPTYLRRWRMPRAVR